MQVQVVALGARGVGKSSILCRFLFHQFPSEYKPTLDEFYIHILHMDGECVQ
jgi:Ras-related protein Rap-2C/DIRAS family GTP-binding Ras-like protein 2